MSLLFPYSISDILTSLSELFSLDLSSLTTFEQSCLLVLVNAYFFLFWFIIIYFALKIFNRIWERLF